MIALGPIFQAVGAVVDLIIEAGENFAEPQPQGIPPIQANQLPVHKADHSLPLLAQIIINLPHKYQ